jgi:hypothetical protein
MAGYTKIADVGNTIVKLLQSRLVPDVVQNNNLIGLCEINAHEDFILGVHLYNIEQNQDMRMNSYINSGENTQIAPPIFLNLYYMITAYSQSDANFRSAENQIILGRTIQVLNDCSYLVDEQGSALHIDMINLNFHDKKDIWGNSDSKSSRLSVFYRVAPIEIPSTRDRKVVRVSGIDLDSYMKGKNNQ